MSTETVDHPVIVTPVTRESMTITCTSPWALNGSEYHPQNAAFKLLINGEEAFGAVHRAIANAQKSVSIICWGFQPSMYFIRDGSHPSIGQLLEERAENNVKVRVLCWELALANLPVNTTGKAGESNTPGRWRVGLKNRPPSTNDTQYKIDVDWYNKYDEDQEWCDELLKWARSTFGDEKKASTRRAQNLHFRGRGFSTLDRLKLAVKHYDDDISLSTRGVLSAVPTHHQKMVLVDYEDPELAVGFVMGHNMLDEYWDTSEHSSKPRTFYRTTHPEEHPNTVANGLLPRHDFSSMVTGPILGDLYNNFATAWDKADGDKMSGADFKSYPVRKLDGMEFIEGQILRTQSQEGRQDIKSCYLQAVNNATQYIHIENQYFRWPPLADAIKAAAEKQTQNGRVPERDGYLYLFVITNSGDEGVGAGIDNTYRMMKALGRTDTLPQVARQDKLAEIEQARWKVTRLEAERAQLDEQAGLLNGLPNTSPRMTARYEANARDLEAAKERLKALEANQDAIKQEYDQQEAKSAEGSKAKNAEDQWQDEIDHKDSVIQPEPIPGLKSHICTLVAPDTEDGKAWMEVYIHAKLMLIDDTFMTLGSANINTRSMQVDSELNITHHRPEVTKNARQRLWAKHTGWASGGEICSAKELAVSYDTWGILLERNRSMRVRHQSPQTMIAALVRLSAKRANLD